MNSDSTITASEAARIIGCHRTEVSRLSQPGGVLEHALVEPGAGRKAARYSRRAIEVYAAALREQRPLDAQHERARKDRAAADMSEFKLRVEQGEYLPADEVLRQQIAEAGAVKARILRWADTSADKIARAFTRDGVAGVEAVLDRMAYEILEELADPDRPIACRWCGADMVTGVTADTTCGAPTKNGNPCTRPAGDGGRCYQHRG